MTEQLLEAEHQAKTGHNVYWKGVTVIGQRTAGERSRRSFSPMPKPIFERPLVITLLKYQVKVPL